MYFAVSKTIQAYTVKKKSELFYIRKRPEVVQASGMADSAGSFHVSFPPVLASCKDRSPYDRN